MIEKIEQPLAYALVSWLLPEEGGRSSGPPTAPVYAATCVFPLGGETEVQSDWPASTDQLSVLLQEVEEFPDRVRLYKIDFLVRDLARPFLHPGADMLVMEGPKVVAKAAVLSVVGKPTGDA